MMRSNQAAVEPHTAALVHELLAELFGYCRYLERSDGLSGREAANLATDVEYALHQIDDVWRELAPPAVAAPNNSERH